ncbi:MAG: NAD-dependent epimerase/dehydratase family protein [Rhodocyclaceae bacterium]|nr:NAD-dependent epimerase/dehydratase family protein [Rhodocyclaceae bacterium]MCO5097804.1 NAD-dependent epimerase/dehydratase family protein [Rhodocyclaceae bacterium]
MNGQRVLVIGAGFLGRALANRLAGEGAGVSVLSPRVDAADWPTGVTAVPGRQEDAALLGELLDRHDTVIHAAWGTTPGSSASRPLLEAEKGLNPFLAFLTTLQRFPETRLLFLSSGGTVYGDPADLPVPESAPFRPLSCHGAGKAAAELFLGLRAPDKIIILRPSNIYGPEQPLRSGFGVVRHLLHCAAEETPFQLWGDGRQVRDYLFIDDFTEAILQLTARPDLHGVFNLGSGNGTTLRELIGKIQTETGRVIRIDAQPARSADVARIVLDVTRIRNATEWMPTVSLIDGIARMRRWLEGTA